MPLKTVDMLVEASGLSHDEVAARSGLPVERVNAIVEGRWTPSPAERAQIAAALEVTIDAVSWGHTMNPRNVRYRRFGLPETF